jgi:transporter family-2 protein
MNAIPFMVLGGAPQTCGAAMNDQLNKSFVNPWLASAVSFALTTFSFVRVFLICPHRLPTTRNLQRMPWWRR